MKVGKPMHRHYVIEFSKKEENYKSVTQVTECIRFLS